MVHDNRRQQHVARRWIVLIVVWLAGAAYVASGLNDGWVPHDEGLLAQSAERVLAGELPHRDFDDAYTGGLSFVNAAAFRILGTKLTALRFPLLVVFLAWIPAVYAIASRFASPFISGTVVLLAVTWSLPNYSAAIPSWYNLFFATFGTMALVAHVEDPRPRRLLAAGFWGGVSVLFKIAGLYYIAAAVVFLVFREQWITRAKESLPPRARSYVPFLGLGALVFVALLLVLIRSRLGVVELVHFVLPGACLAALVVWNEWLDPRGRLGARLMTLFRLLGPFALGVAIPIGLFVVPYALSSSVGDLLTGVFVSPARRLSFSTMDLPGSFSMAAALPLAMVIGVAQERGRRANQVIAAVTGIVLVGAFIASGHAGIYRWVWYSMRPLAPLTVVAGVLFLARRRCGLDVTRRQQLMLLVSVTGMCSLVQFPFSAPIYFFYVAPLTVLAASALVLSQRQARQPVVVVVLVFYLLFAARWVNTGFIHHMGHRYVPHDHTEVLALDRGGLRVSAEDSQQYEELVAVLLRVAKGGFTYATPDCPEVYFLSGLRNPTRTMFDFFDDPEGRTGRILEALKQRQVTAIVLNLAPEFSPPPSPELAAGLVARFAQRRDIGRFVVRWRE